MQVVVDTNVLISALLKPSKTQEILFSDSIFATAPEYSLQEIEDHSDELIKKMGQDKNKFLLAKDLIFMNVSIVPRNEYIKHESQEKEISPDKDDFPFFALALAKGIPIWSNDKKLKSQDVVKVYSTKELLGFMEG